jgi:stearoyl-CoA desaturase (delta-9 desaturase)
LRWLNRNHWVPGLALAVGCFLVGGWSGLVWGFLVSTVLLFHAVFAVNSLCHLVGRRRYATPDQSRNNLGVALITLGEGWHNNHHHYQSSANQGFFWWEIDVCYYLIRLLGSVGLVWDIRGVPSARLPAQLQQGVAALAGMPNGKPTALQPAWESLIADARAGLSPAQMVDGKLAALLGYVPCGRRGAPGDERSTWAGR